MAQPEVLPAEYVDGNNKTLSVAPFTAVDESSTDQETTVADLEHLNMLLERCHYAAPHINTMGGLAALSATMCKLIEVRRAVKKLPYGAPKQGAGGTRSIIPLD